MDPAHAAEEKPFWAHGKHWDCTDAAVSLDTPAERLVFPCVIVHRLSTFDDWVVHCQLCANAILFRSFGGVITCVMMPPDKAGLLYQELRAARCDKHDVIYISCRFGDLECAKLHVPVQFTRSPAPSITDQELHRAGVPWPCLPMNQSGGPCANVPCHRQGTSKCVACWAKGLRVYYCSKQCQTAHWDRGHRNHCGKSNPSHGAQACAHHPCKWEGKQLCARCDAQGLQVYYCSRKCQKAHWKNGHKEKCGKYSTVW